MRSKILQGFITLVGILGVAYAGYYLYFYRSLLFISTAETHGPHMTAGMYARPLSILVPSLIMVWWGYKKLRAKPVVMSEEARRELVENWGEEPVALPSQVASSPPAPEPRSSGAVNAPEVGNGNQQGNG